MENVSVKRIVIFNVVSIVLLFVGGFLNQNLLHNAAPKSSLSVFYMYLFFALFASVIITAVEFLYRQMPDKIGYIFLIGTFIKLGFFTMIFLGKGLLDKQLLMAEKLSIITPLFLYILLEVVAIYGKLNLDLSNKEKK